MGSLGPQEHVLGGDKGARVNPCFTNSVSKSEQVRKTDFFEGGLREPWDAFFRTSGVFCNGNSINLQNLKKNLKNLNPGIFVTDGSESHPDISQKYFITRLFLANISLN